MPRLFPVIASLEANSRTDGGVILWAAFAQLGGGPGKICAKAARFNDRDLDPERSDFFEQRLRETLNPELRGCVRCAPCWSDASCDRGYLDDVSGPALTEVGQHSLGHDDDAKIGWSQSALESRRVAYLQLGTQTVAGIVHEHVQSSEGCNRRPRR